MRIHILTIENRDGAKVSAHTTHVGARSRLLRFVRESWSTASKNPMPDDPDEAIRIYFELQDTRLGEDSHRFDMVDVED